MSREILAGVAGAGVFGGHHAAKYAAIPGVSVSAIFDIDIERASALAERHGAEPFADFERFCKAVDVATVASPAAAHFDIARRLLEAGRHVLVEKPIALRTDHAALLVALAEERSLTLQVGHQERFVMEALGLMSPAHAPKAVHCVRANPPTGRGDDVSVVYDLMIHDLDLLRALGMGALGAVDVSGDRDNICADLVCENGRARLEARRTAPDRDRRMRMVFDDGVVEIDFIRRTVSNTTGRTLSASFDDNAAASAALSDPLGYGVGKFIEAVRAGARPAISGAAGRAALEWAVEIESQLAALEASAPARLRAGGGA